MFCNWEFDPDTGQLSDGETDVRLRPQSAEVLRQLIEQAPQVVTREAIRARLWPGAVIVDYDTGINACIKQIRKALGSSADLVVTIPKKGFRLQTGQMMAAATMRRERRLPSPITTLMALIGLCLLLLSRSPDAPLSAALAIMPFAIASSDSSSTALSQQLHSDLMLHLSAQAEMPLVSSRSVHALSDESLDTPALGKRLRAKLIIEGQLRRLNRSHVLMLSLSDVSSGYVIWSQLIDIHDHSTQQDTAIMLQAVTREIDLLQANRPL